MYKKITEGIIGEIKNIVGENNVILEKERLEDYSHDEFAMKTLSNYPEIAVKPENSLQVSELMKLANKESFPVVARGGGTGLCGGCVPSLGGVVLSLEKMNRILEVDTENLMAEMEAGVSLEEFYTAIKEKKMFFPPHPGEESATIGGVLSTNAGGSRAVKYGTVRNFIRGMEVVLPDGSITSLGGRILKDSSGYSLMHLMVGSEGTLGVITKATLSIMPVPASTLTLIVPYDNILDAFKTVPHLLMAGILPLALEFIGRQVIAASEDYLGKSWPVQQGEFFLMIILEGEDAELMSVSEKISEICLEFNAVDVFVAQPQEKQEEILAIRSLVYEALKSKTAEILDIVLPRDRMEEHIRYVEELSEKYNIWLPTYGHAADGNLHTHIMKTDRNKKNITDWKEIYEAVRKEIHLDAKKRGGKVSGEHGIGLAKKEYLGLFTDEPALRMMKEIKKVFDPNNILNPGKIF
ncbi:MAG: FAD-binding oxidoreductase [Candidatus Omnitrophica bacterium]|nr:FAD-binding oxidoreductase [Candidatus Omnitrophota bacterium]